ncbi:DUF2653 family protein [Sporosarcina sp. Sa2YVA2]|uniref:DUF2653 family protein n=1 Tax=Sporosarcina quadrami TaxID=2762234 RepID=A0ABR8UDZ4_9BACL|nr:DUF2653 family protein [Sporosarcina quadrami]MBD7986255.1 DUF2653 family protein [Sporosarcina quadrami]
MADQIISEQDIINAICIEQAHSHTVQPEDVEVELLYDDEYGFSAEAHIGSQVYVLSTFEMIQAIRFWIEHVLHEDPYAAGLKLLLDREEGIIAAMH